MQCGLIESYFWLERSTGRLVPLPVETDPPDSVDAWQPAHRAVLSCADSTKKTPPLDYQDLELGRTEQH